MAWPEKPVKLIAPVSTGTALDISLRMTADRLSQALGRGLYELRHVGKLNTRIIWFFAAGRRIIAVHGIRNKGQEIPPRELVVARERMDDWRGRER